MRALSLLVFAFTASGCSSSPEPGGWVDATPGTFRGAQFVQEKRSDNGFAGNAAMAVRLSILEGGKYTIEQVSSPVASLEKPIKLASGKAVMSGDKFKLEPVEKLESPFSVLGWRFDKALKLKKNKDNSLSLEGKPNGTTDAPGKGVELRFVKA